MGLYQALRVNSKFTTIVDVGLLFWSFIRTVRSNNSYAYIQFFALGTKENIYLWEQLL